MLPIAAAAGDVAAVRATSTTKPEIDAPRSWLVAHGVGGAQRERARVARRIDAHGDTERGLAREVDLQGGRPIAGWKEVVHTYSWVHLNDVSDYA